MKSFVNNNAQNYDIIFFYHIRSSQYLPENFYGEKIIEMGDLYSNNYSQTCNFLNTFNPLKYIYLLESYLVKKIEEKISLGKDLFERKISTKIYLFTNLNVSLWFFNFIDLESQGLQRF